MGHGKETPRQKMIGMMYLFLTCMLALNVSKDILDAFIQINNTLNETNANFVSKNQIVYDRIDKAYAANPKKVQRVKDDAERLRQKTDSLVNRYQHYKDSIIIYADGIPQNVLIRRNGKSFIYSDDLKDTVAIEEVVKSKDNLDKPAQIMVGSEQDGSKGEAKKLKENYVDPYREFVLDLLTKYEKDTANSVLMKNVRAALNTNPVRLKGSAGATVSWANRWFEYLPLMAVVANLTQMQSQVRNIEGDILNRMYQGLDETDFKFNKLVPIIVPAETYIMQGNEYSAQIFIAAFDTTSPTKVEVGGRELPIDPKTGLPTYKTIGGGLGPQKYSATIKVKNPSTDEVTPYTVTGEYQVAKAGLVVSPTKMNVFYIGVDNPVAISVPGVPADKISAYLTPAGAGTITKAAGGNYVVRVTTPGRVNIAVTADFNGNKKSMGQEEFRVKRVPDPVASVLNQESGQIDKARLSAATTVDARMKDFDFDLSFSVQSFEMSAKIGIYFETLNSQSNRITPQMKQKFAQLTKGSKVYFENIKAVGAGSTRSLPALAFTIN